MSADPKTFTFLPLVGVDDVTGPEFAKDKNHVYMFYFEGPAVVPDADPNTFTFFGPYYFYEKDKNHVYRWGAILAGADPTTFVVLREGPWAKDARHVFFSYEQLPDADPATFGFYDQYGSYVHDDRHVWWDDFMVPGADPSTFETFPITPEPGSDGQYAKDTQHIYFQDQILTGADFPTFKVLERITDGADATDKYHAYHGGYIIR